jgi:hypothetical protein
MSQEIRREFFAVDITGAVIQLEPVPNSETHPAIPGLSRIRLTTVETTPDTQFFPAAGTCQRYEVIIRRKTA